MFQVNRVFAVLFIFTALFQGCTPQRVDPSPAFKKKVHISSPNNFTLNVVHYGSYTDENKSRVDEVVMEMQDQYIAGIIHNSINDDSLAAMIKTLLPMKKVYSKISDLFFYDDSVVVQYSLDTAMIHSTIDPIIATFGYPEKRMIYPLFTTDHNPPKINDINDLKLKRPCANASIPSRTLLLPNAPRKYRKGIHRGIDFVVDWGTPVMAVAKGIVIRSDRSYKEFGPNFRKQLLKIAEQLGHTPSDVFEHVLLGRSVFIDHGFDLIDGYRAVSIYAHLSHIDNNIEPGTSIKAGQRIGLSGNSGTEDGTLGKRSGAHLHWELILQDGGGEYYLGQGWPTAELYEKLVLFFDE